VRAAVFAQLSGAAKISHDIASHRVANLLANWRAIGETLGELQTVTFRCFRADY
jgi:hypothetical protein